MPSPASLRLAFTHLGDVVAACSVLLLLVSLIRRDLVRFELWSVAVILMALVAIPAGLAVHPACAGADGGLMVVGVMGAAGLFGWLSARVRAVDPE